MFIGDAYNRSKLGRLYEDYKSRLFIAAKGILSDDALAEDAVHDTYVRIVKYMYKIDESNIGRDVYKRQVIYSVKGQDND